MPGRVIPPRGGPEAQRTGAIAAAAERVAAREAAASAAEKEAEELDPLVVGLARARQVAPRLGAATDALNASLERVEQAIAGLKLGVTASVPLYEGPPDHDWHQALTFGKDGSSWRLSLESWNIDEP